MISLKDMFAVLAAQPTLKKRWGEIAVAQGFLTVEQIDELLDLQEKTLVRLGELLVQHEILGFDVVATKLEEYHATLAVEQASKD